MILSHSQGRLLSTRRLGKCSLIGGPLLTLLLYIAFVQMGCSQSETPDEYVVRLGDAYLMDEEIQAALATMSPYQDSLSAYEQYLSRWVTNQLLVQEARRRDLENDPDVVRRLQENEQSVLISKLLDQIYELAPDAPASDVRQYFDRNRDRLRLREPYLRIRYFGSSDSAIVAAVSDEMQSISEGSEREQDSLWFALIRREADDPEACLSLSTQYYPASQLFSSLPALRAAVLSLRPGQFSDILEETEQYHLVQFVERIPEDSLPEIEWVEREIRQRLLIQSRKQMYADQVERLRNEALAREALEIRGQ